MSWFEDPDADQDAIRGIRELRKLGNSKSHSSRANRILYRNLKSNRALMFVKKGYQDVEPPEVEEIDIFEVLAGLRTYLEK